MIADKEKIQIAMARTCLGLNDIAKEAKMPVQTVRKVIACNRSVKPNTIGKVAKALQVDVTEILAEEKENN